MRFPSRRDYIRQLQAHGLIIDEPGFEFDDCLVEAVYLDWLRRPQVGCVFAQLLARPRNRTGLRTVVARGDSGHGYADELALQIDGLVHEAVSDDSHEALSVLLPEVLDMQKLALLIWELGNLPRWVIEGEHRWRDTTVLIGLRVEIAAQIFAETLGMGPFSIFPPTRQCPVTTLEIRTKTLRAKKSHTSRTHRAAHLADIPVRHILTAAQIGLRFSTYTPWLRKRILQGQEDMRAKAGVTYSIPAAIWSSVKAGSP